jgi:hypothetical protein
MNQNFLPNRVVPLHHHDPNYQNYLNFLLNQNFLLNR